MHVTDADVWLHENHQQEEEEEEKEERARVKHTREILRLRKHGDAGLKLNNSTVT